jgi:hypothetical protein
VPLDQDDAKPLLKGMQLLAKRRLRNVAGLRSATEIVEVGDCDEIFKLA